ncbi:MAG: hypothetical protein AAF570_11675 [Bacteroidota bacterium]
MKSNSPYQTRHSQTDVPPSSDGKSGRGFSARTPYPATEDALQAKLQSEAETSVIQLMSDKKQDMPGLSESTSSPSAPAPEQDDDTTDTSVPATEQKATSSATSTDTSSTSNGSSLASTESGASESKQVVAASSAVDKATFQGQATSLLQQIDRLIDTTLFDPRHIVPLKPTDPVYGRLQAIRTEVRNLSRHFRPADSQTFVTALGAAEAKLQAIRSIHDIFHVGLQYDGFIRSYRLMEAAGVFRDPGYVQAAQTVMANPLGGASAAEAKAKSDEDQQSDEKAVVARGNPYDKIKGVLGEYLGAAVIADALDGFQHEEYDTIIHGIQIIEPMNLRADEKRDDNARWGPINNSPRHGRVRGELDSLFVKLHPRSGKWIPILAVESKGGALSSQKVKAQVQKEEAAIQAVYAGDYHFALRPDGSPERGAFTIITRDFDLNATSNRPGVVTTGPIRSGSQQYDFTLGFTPQQFTMFCRWAVYYRNLHREK